jgi:DNA-directed RNA polymerase specialized sigma24 family protein
MQPRALWELDKESLDRLLTAFDADRRAAGCQYEKLRRRLIRFFEWEKCALPDRDADETLNRVARRLSEGTEVKSIVAFTLGVARFVLLERQSQTRLLDRALEEMAATASVPTPETDARLLTCFQSCFARLPEETRALLRRYYGGEESGRIANRGTLARELGVEQNALRNRVFRSREKLMLCILRCARKDFSPNKSADSITSITEES